jgi:hypothetical protein
MHTQILTRAAALTLLLSAGCGELADEDSTPPVLTKLRGSLRVGDGASTPQGSIRVALVWHMPHYEQPDEACYSHTVTPDGRRFVGSAAATFEQRLLLGAVAQDVAITPQFPSAFELDITAAPPEEAMYDAAEGGLRKAEGSIVVYRDGNGNGRLDPHPAGASSPDEVLSGELWDPGVLQSVDPRTTTRPWGYQVWYLSSAHEWTPEFSLHAGYNLLAWKEAITPVSELDIELLPTPALWTQLCTNECVTNELTPFECPASPAALPTRPDGALAGYVANGKGWVWSDGPNGYGYEARNCTRSEDGKYYFSWTRQFANGCETRRQQSCNYGPAATPPADWPCDSYVDFTQPPPEARCLQRPRRELATVTPTLRDGTVVAPSQDAAGPSEPGSELLRGQPRRAASPRWALFLVHGLRLRRRRRFLRCSRGLWRLDPRSDDR